MRREEFAFGDEKRREEKSSPSAMRREEKSSPSAMRREAPSALAFGEGGLCAEELGARREIRCVAGSLGEALLSPKANSARSKTL